MPSSKKHKRQAIFSWNNQLATPRLTQFDGNVETGFGKLAYQYSKQKLPLMVLHGRQGYYIGALDDREPLSRESVETWQDCEIAVKSLTTAKWLRLDYGHSPSPSHGQINLTSK